MKFLVAISLLLAGVTSLGPETQKPRTFDEVIFSDDQLMIEGSSKMAVYCRNSPLWSAVIPGAKWVWSSYSTFGQYKEVRTFYKTFTINGSPSSGTLLIAADDYFKTTINGMDANCLSTIPAFFDSTKMICDVSAFLIKGSNQISIQVTNTGTTALIYNYGGLLFRLDYTYRSQGA